MPDDRLMALTERLFQGQQRLFYFLLTIEASAIVLILGRLEDTRVDGVFWLLVLALLCWVFAFYLGVMYLVNTNGVLLANVQAMKIEEGTHELLPPGDPVFARQAHSGLRGTAKMWRDRARDSAAWHARLLVSGALLYSTWILVHKFG